MGFTDELGLTTTGGGASPAGAFQCQWLVPVWGAEDGKRSAFLQELTSVVSVQQTVKVVTRFP